jgi:hypothetical protein
MSRFTEEEQELKDAGKCSVQTEYGNGGDDKLCGDKSAKGTQDGDCVYHDQERQDGNR